MPKKSYKVQIVRDYETQEEALKAAVRVLHNSEQVAVFEETSTTSGQCYERLLIWKNGAEKRQRG